MAAESFWSWDHLEAGRSGWLLRGGTLSDGRAASAGRCRKRHIGGFTGVCTRVTRHISPLLMCGLGHLL